MSKLFSRSFFWHIFLVAMWLAVCFLQVNSLPQAPQHTPSPAYWKQKFTDSSNYPNTYRQGTHKYRNMAITTILYNHFQKDNIKQIMFHSRPICQITGALKYSLKEIQPSYLKEREKKKTTMYLLLQDKKTQDK